MLLKAHFHLAPSSNLHILWDGCEEMICSLKDGIVKIFMLENATDERDTLLSLWYAVWCRLFCHTEQLCLSTKNLTNTNITCPINQIFMLTCIVEHILTKKKSENQAVFGNDIKDAWYSQWVYVCISWLNDSRGYSQTLKLENHSLG